MPLEKDPEACSDLFDKDRLEHMHDMGSICPKSPPELLMY